MSCLLMEMNATIAENIDVLMIDTACGSFPENKRTHLMAELRPAVRIIAAVYLIPHEILLAPRYQLVKNALRKLKNFQNYACDRNCIDQDRWSSSRWVVLRSAKSWDDPVS